MNLLQLKSDFPIFINNPELIYLDSGATTQKPHQVIDAMQSYMTHTNGTVKRGIYKLSHQSTELYEQARQSVQQFINAKSTKEIVLTNGCTDAINLVASSWGSDNLSINDEILLTELEHHANIVPWQLIAECQNANIKALPINIQSGELRIDLLPEYLTEKTKLIAITHVSNALGIINPVKQIIKTIRQYNPDIKILLDGCQAAPHLKIDVQDLDCDFYAFSSHKIYGSTGIGVLYAKEQILETMPPYRGGGDMIDTVSFSKTTYADIPERFEAGTPPIIESIGLHHAIQYINNIGHHAIEQHENNLLQYALNKLSDISEVQVLGDSLNKASLVSFIVKDIHHYDIATLLDETNNIAIRTGHHCCQPLMNVYNISGTNRISMGIYNDMNDIDVFIRSLKEVINILK